MSVKDELLTALEQSIGKEISGQTLADLLGVTRAAVWKASKALKDEGYPIVATRNKGYRLEKESDIISPQGIRKYMDPAVKDWELTVLQTVDSTNNYAKTLLADFKDSPILVTALEQTAGRGRKGHSFYSPKGTGVYMSILLKPTLSPPTLITAAAAVAVCMACEELTNASPKIKWVNDVFLNDKKFCGILTEGILDMESNSLTAAIVGIGVNLSTSDFPSEIKTVAGSLNAKEISRNMVIGRIASHLNALLKAKKELILKEYKSRLMVLNKTVSYKLNGRSKTGVAVDINDSCNLIVKTKNGEDVLTAGEISLEKYL